MLPASPRRQGVSSAHPQRYQGIRHLHKASYYIIYPRRFARNESYERSCFLADKDPGTLKKVQVVAVVLHISWATARPSPLKHVGGLTGTVDVGVVVAVVHHITWAAVRAGPSKHIGRLMGRSSSTSHLMGHGPGRPVKARGRPHGHGGCRRSIK